MPGHEFPGIGKINYEGFAGSLGWKRNGAPMPAWRDLPPREQAAFEAAARDVMQRGWADSQRGRQQ